MYMNIRKKNLSEDYKKQIRRYLDRFVDSLIEEKYSLKH
jgi:hypothetical protein